MNPSHRGRKGNADKSTWCVAVRKMGTHKEDGGITAKTKTEEEGQRNNKKENMMENSTAEIISMSERKSGTSASQHHQTNLPLQQDLREGTTLGLV